MTSSAVLHEPDQRTRALRDLYLGLLDWRVWSFLGAHDIRQRYRRSTLGPLWLALGMAVNVASIGLIWSTLFNLKAHEFVPHLCLGMMVWNLILGMCSEGCMSFISAGGYITQTNRPLSTYVLWVAWRNVLIAAHTFLVYIGVAAAFQIWPTAQTLAVIPGTALMLLSTTWLPLTLGILSARYRDLPQIIQSILTVLFFITPVLWRSEQLGERAYIAEWNPLTHIIDLVRAPLLGEPLSPFTWGMALATAILGWGLALYLFARYRQRIPYWL